MTKMTPGLGDRHQCNHNNPTTQDNKPAALVNTGMVTSQSTSTFISTWTAQEPNLIMAIRSLAC